MPWRDAEPWQANLQELEPPTCGGEKRTFRKRLPKEAGATERKRIAGSETAGVTARSTKRSAGTEAVKADGVESEAKTRKADDVDVPTCPPQHQRERGRGTDFESFRTVVTAFSPLLNNTPHIFVNFRNRINGEESPNTEGGGQYAYDFDTCSRCERK